MAALLGVVLSCATLMTTTTATGVAGAGVADGDLCVPGAAACRAGNALPWTAPGAAEDDETYATPAEIDCRATVQTKRLPGAPDRLLLSGDCESTVLDLRYRVSRSADSERPTGAFRSDRARRSVRSAPTATGLPRDTGALVTASVPPMALYASHDLVPPAPCVMAPESGTPVATRVLDPPDRPPRL